MVHSSSRPMVYKQRVLGRQGHLSNQQCAELLLEVAHPGLKHIHLAHLSEECNHPRRALEVIQSALNTLQLTIEISIALQHQISKSILF